MILLSLRDVQVCETFASPVVVSPPRVGLRILRAQRRQRVHVPGRGREGRLRTANRVLLWTGR